MKHPHAHLQRSVAAYLKAMGLTVLNEAASTVAGVPGARMRVEVVYECVARLNVQHGPALLLHRQGVARVRELHRLLWGNEAFRQLAGLERLKLADAWLAPKPKSLLQRSGSRHGLVLVDPSSG